MRNIFLSLLLITLYSPVLATENKEHDPQLIGAWKGEAKNASGTLKKWTHIKRPDGTFIAHFKDNKKTEKGYKHWRQRGTWWTKDGLIYIHEKWMEKPAVYKYKLNGNCIKYTLHTNVEGSDVKDSYSFSECKTDLNKYRKPK